MDGPLPRELEALHQLARGLRTQMDRRSVLESIVHSGKELLGCRIVWVGLKDFTRPLFALGASAGAPLVEELPVRPHTMAGRAFYENRTVVENAYDRSPQALQGFVKQGFCVAMAMPLCDSGRPIGV